MLAYLFVSAIWISLETSDRTVIECTTNEDIVWNPDVEMIHISDCSDEIFSDGFE